jgi:hypothetical protein
MLICIRCIPQQYQYDISSVLKGVKVGYSLQSPDMLGHCDDKGFKMQPFFRTGFFAKKLCDRVKCEVSFYFNYKLTLNNYYRTGMLA